VIATLRERTGVTILMTTHYLDEAERLCDRIAIVEAGQIVACDSPANLLASLGPEILEVRTDTGSAVESVLRSGGIDPGDIVVIGSTVTASLRTLKAISVLDRLAETGISLRSATTRTPTLDDVYLRLTGGRIDPPT
jgi:ABC-2 type transport system ATP-binding protein